MRRRKRCEALAFYVPSWGIVFAGDPTPYQEQHEWAHVDQHARRTLAWRAWWAAWSVPYVRRWTQLLVELEATLMALWTMYRCGILEPLDVAEAGIRLTGHFMGKT